VAVYTFYLILIWAVFYIIGACIVAVAHLYCVYGLNISLLCTAIVLF
jgi:hypothetical protein